MSTTIAYQWAQRFVCLVVLAAVAACGGGGDGESKSIANGGIEITPKTVEFTLIKEAESQVSKSIAVNVVSPEVALIAAGYAPGVQQPNWLSVNVSGTMPALALELTVYDAGLEPGIYTTSLRVVTGRQNETLIGYLDVPVTFTLKRQLASTQKEINLDIVSGAPYQQAAAELSVVGTGMEWTAKASERWVTLSSTSGIAPARVIVGVNTSGLTQGSYKSDLTITPTNGSPPFVVKINLILRAASLNTGSSSLDFSSIQGGQQNINGLIFVNSTGSPLNWNAKADQPWIIISPASGTALNPYTYSSSTINVSVNTNGLPVGQHSGSIIITDQNGGQQTLPVTLFIRKPQVGSYSSLLSFDSAIGGPAPQQQYAALFSNGEPLTWTASSSQPWVKLNPATGSTPADLAVSVDPSGLTAGSYTGVVTVSDSNGTSISIQVSYTLNAPALIVGSPYYGNQLNFYAVNGNSMEPLSVEIRSNNGRPATWSAVSNAPWLKISKGSGAAPDMLEVSVDAATSKLASGNYNSSINFNANIDGQSVNTTLNVSLTLLKPNIGVRPEQIVLGGTGGHDRIPQPVFFSSDLNKAVTWTVAPSESWIKPDKTTFVSGQTQYSEMLAVSVSPQAAALTKGNYTGSLKFTATVNGDTLVRDIPVTFAVDAHRIHASEDAVALAKTPGQSRLSRSVNIMENFGGSANWKAVSDKQWLTVTSTGKAPGALVVTADATGLATDQVHYATVTVSSPDTVIENSEKIRVGLWIGSSGLTSKLQINSAYTEIESDPLRPYIYVHNGVSDITVLNAYTGGEVTKIVQVAPQLGDMQASSDGSILYVVDKTNLRVMPIDLNTFTVGNGWPLGQNNNYGIAFDYRLDFVRTNGFGALIVNDGYAYHAQSGLRLLNNPAWWFGHNLTVAREVASLYSGSAYFTWENLVRTVLDYSYTDAKLHATRITNFAMPQPSSHGSDLAARADGSKVYSAGSTLGDFIQLNGYDLSYAGALPGGGAATNVMVGQDGRVYGAANNPGGAKDLWVYDANGFPVTSMRVAGANRSVLGRQLIQSSDGLLLILLTDDPTLQIIPINF